MQSRQPIPSGCNTTATSGRSWPRTASPATGPDSAARKADLRLDRREAAIEAGAIAPGEPEASELIARINAEDPKELMPPPQDEQEADRAAEGPACGAGSPTAPSISRTGRSSRPSGPTLPAVKNAAWARNPIDRFVLAKLEENGLQPAPEADRRTLARRLSLDLTGLPPDPADVEAFVERSGRPTPTRSSSTACWTRRTGASIAPATGSTPPAMPTPTASLRQLPRDLGLSRLGHQRLQPQPAVRPVHRSSNWPATCCPTSTLDQQVASGFNRCNITTNEGGAIAEEYLVLYARDRTETVSQVWLGLTAGCAVCHDHKFDPITPERVLRAVGVLQQHDAADHGRQRQGHAADRLRAERRTIADAGGCVVGQARRGSQSNSTVARTQPGRISTHGWPRPSPTGTDRPDPNRQPQAGGGHSRGSRAPGRPARHLNLPMPATSTRIRRSPTGPGSSCPRRGWTARCSPGWTIGKTTAAGTSGSRTERVGGSSGPRVAGRMPSRLSRPARCRRASGRIVFATYDGSGKAAGLKIYVNGALQPTKTQADTLTKTIRTEVPLKVGQRHTSSRLEQTLIHTVRIYDRAARGRRGVAARRGGPRGGASANAGGEALKGRARGRIRLVARGDRPGFQAAAQQARGAREGGGRHQGRGTVAHVMQERAEPPMAYVLFRGEYDKRRDAVKPDTPDALPPMPAELPQNRLGLAQWLLRPEHPLTARVTVNRFWQEVFGTGLVRTTGDFGVSGELPSHPELLDWLAVEFRESGWDVKRFFRLLVKSATYRQSAATTPEKLEKDPHNRLLSRGPRFRMDAEMVRDYALACQRAAGRQDRRARASSRISPRACGRPWPCRKQHALLPARHGESCIAAACTRSGSGAPRRPRWTSSTRPPARSAPCAASGPTRRCRRW